ncbi:unnamed protein product [Hymenolepis diminuta]|uniref:Ubiquitin carboxyl-terminal hydrolase 36 n=1 Tax=Hymenolepis diminuta TaxID=6216 RepID=A0A564YZ56_HYMDI|nr:unnamed protein product [Hymenolepis diminuta]
MSTTCSVASFKQTSNHSNLTNNTNGFCTNLNQTVAASLSDRPRLTQAPKSMAMLGKAVPFIFSRTVPLEESIKEKFRNLHNATILSDTSVSQGDRSCDRDFLEYCTRGDLSVPIVPMGLTNFNNQCYQNSTLQSLLVTGPLLYFIMEKHKPSECPLANKCEFCSLCGIYRLVKMHCKDNAINSFRTITPSYFRCHLGKFGSFSHDQQEDAQEYLNGVLTSFVKCLDTTTGGNTNALNIIQKMFYGSLLYLYTCTSCRNVTLREEMFCNLPLTIGNYYSLQHILGAQRGVNMIEDYSCPACKRRVTAEHRELVLKAPPILTLHLLRFVGDSKNNSYIRFPLTFDFRPYMASRNGKSLNYQLYAMIIHEGAETAFGHYVACTNRRGVWYEISDAIVTHIDVQQVLAKKPYILFYKLVNPEDTLCFPENTENIKKQVLAAAAKSNSSSPQISNNSFSQKFIFPWRSPSHAPSVINSSNSAAQFPSVTPQPAASKLNPNVSAFFC